MVKLTQEQKLKIKLREELNQGWREQKLWATVIIWLITLIFGDIALWIVLKYCGC